MSKNSESKTEPYFIPARLFESPSDWYVFFSCVDPLTEKMRRKKIHINYIKSIPERRRYAKFLVNKINDDLYSGWNPWDEEVVAHNTIKLTDALDQFLRIKKRELRETSVNSYTSFSNMTNDYLQTMELENITTTEFGAQQATKMIDWFYDTKNISTRTFNNYRTFFRALWNWMIEKQYCRSNPWLKITPKKQLSKTRTIIESEEDRKKIADYFKMQHKPMYYVCLLVYHSLIRPNEVSKLKPSNFDFERQVLYIPSDTNKTNIFRVTTIPDVILGELIEWNFGGAKPHQYIFGKEFMPGNDRISPKTFSKRWSSMRKRTNLPANYHLYSLRDTGIVMLLRAGVPIDEVMKQAGHTNLETTSIYVRHYLPTGSEIIKLKGEKFG